MLCHKMYLILYTILMRFNSSALVLVLYYNLVVILKVMIRMILAAVTGTVNVINMVEAALAPHAY
jgi:hypothetical protein